MKNKFQITMFYLVIIDILFIPYIKNIPVKPFMIIVIVWYIRKGLKYYINKKEFIFITLFLLLSIISISIGILKYYQYIPMITFLSYNVEAFVILFFGILLYYYFKYIYITYKPRISTILAVHLIFVFFMAIFYWFSPQQFWIFRSNWTYGKKEVIFTTVLMERFPHIFSEPNNFSVVTTATVLYLLNDKQFKYKAIFAMIGFFSSLTTLSVSGIVVSSLMYSVFFISKIFKKSNINFKFNKNSVLFITLSIISLLIYTFWLKEQVNVMLGDILTRSKIYTDDGNISGSRVTIWINFISRSNFFSKIIFGSGGIVYNGNILKPHNGNLFIIYHFGLISYLIFIMIFMRKNKYIKMFDFYLIAIPFFIILTMNTLVQDLRSFYLFIILMTIPTIYLNNGKLKEGNIYEIKE